LANPTTKPCHPEFDHSRRAAGRSGLKKPFDEIRKWKSFDADTGIDSARELREYSVADFSRWKEHDVYVAEFEKLVRDLKADQSSAGRTATGWS
jgi:hypothetical protein